jgi:hypothetical protein
MIKVTETTDYCFTLSKTVKTRKVYFLGVLVYQKEKSI